MKEKRVDYELLRLLAIFGVVFNHTQEWGYELYRFPEVSRINYSLSILLGVLCKTAVPLFLLISGGLLLDRTESLSVVLKKRVSRIAIALVLFSAIVYLFWIVWGFAPAKPGYCLRLFWSEGISAPYWYLYTYLGLVLLLPLLRPMVQNMEDRAFLYLLVLHLLLYGLGFTIAAIKDWGSVTKNLELSMVEPGLFYFIMGYYLSHRFPWEKLTQKRMVLLYLLAAAAVGIMCLLVHWSYQRYTGYLEIRDSLLAIPVFAVYAGIRRLCEKHPPNPVLSRGIVTLGGCVFGTYLLEGILRHYLQGVYLSLQPYIHTLPACLCWVAAVVVCGLFLTWILKKLPGFRKLL